MYLEDLGATLKTEKWFIKIFAIGIYCFELADK